ncbi:hypothetical protein Syun_006695 [Stephania yunnanensis]|uniref:Uncharacterized protein n=1 Tax=Stephania yunnanensis TaxID=152371 RepID=A0AAP0KYS5_9MAGN
MVLVGRTVKKRFLGLGMVKFFDLNSGHFDIVYDSDDLEEDMNIDDVVSALDGGAVEELEEHLAVRRCGRPLKRRSQRGQEVVASMAAEKLRDLSQPIDSRCLIQRGVKEEGSQRAQVRDLTSP